MLKVVQLMIGIDENMSNTPRKPSNIDYVEEGE